MPGNKRKRGGSGKPLVPPPKLMSRKRARQVTTQFHKLTRQREAATNEQEIQSVDALLDAMGGRKEYQKASQVSTSFHSTSKWVLGFLSRNGWLYGIPLSNNSSNSNQQQQRQQQQDSSPKIKNKIRRPTKILEVGAINTELLDAARPHETVPPKEQQQSAKPRLDVRAIDLHCMDRRIEKADFLKIPVNHPDVSERYDVIVCSMVLNCVPTAPERGEMICRLYHFLRPDGLLFLTIPKTCLNLSPYMDRKVFANLLTCVGLGIQETKESPKIAFYLCKRVSRENNDSVGWDPMWTQLRTIRQGKKYTNDFAVILSKNSYEGETLSFLKKKSNS